MKVCSFLCSFPAERLGKLLQSQRSPQLKSIVGPLKKIKLLSSLYRLQEQILSMGKVQILNLNGQDLNIKAVSGLMVQNIFNAALRQTYYCQVRTIINTIWDFGLHYLITFKMPGQYSMS